MRPGKSSWVSAKRSVRRCEIITRLMRLLTRHGYLVEEQAMTYLAEPDADEADRGLRALQAASCTYRIALGSRAGQKVLSLRSLASTDAIRVRPVR
jgi:hypothetical protein